ncbi:glycosyltransferase family 2 protein [Polycladidibacter stylochi]|uniref:glycosyltransferase family 2 protein n=1 Tax=Polycladidibacter stylochi TaxID=1807766 RepID=UPI000832A38C|nr:glycosyltransferase family 2 protein [Pseudovibrio stylochi]
MNEDTSNRHAKSYAFKARHPVRLTSVNTNKTSQANYKRPHRPRQFIDKLINSVQHQNVSHQLSVQVLNKTLKKTGANKTKQPLTSTTPLTNSSGWVTQKILAASSPSVIEAQVLLQCGLQPEQIEAARQLSEQSRKSIQAVVFSQNLIDEQLYFWVLAARLKLRHAAPGNFKALTSSHKKATCKRIGSLIACPVLDRANTIVWTVSPIGEQLKHLAHLIDQLPNNHRLYVVSSTYQRDLIIANEASLSRLVSSPKESAGLYISESQKKTLLAFSPLLLLMLNYANVFTLGYFLLAFLKAFTIAMGCMKLAAVFMRRKRNAANFPELATLPKNHELPTYSVLVPLYNEDLVCGQLVRALGQLDYPLEKLDIVFLLEQSDTKTFKALSKLKQQHMRIKVVPNGEPRTKPRALGVGLRYTRGQLITIYDAEDRPAPDQLKKAALCFLQADKRLACLQAALHVDHWHESWLVRQFSLEYAALFDVLLPWLSRHKLFFPLGGTSNHFRRDALEDVGGWDAYNVTEDADLAVRFARKGYFLQTLASSTYEEAPLTIKAWLNQRCRWHKGWMQTLMVHLREPKTLVKQLGTRNMLAFLIQMLGGILCLLGMPLMLSLAGMLYYLDDSSALNILENSLLYLGILSFTVGYLGAASSIFLGGLKRGIAVKAYDFLSIPLYWAITSLACYWALLEFLFRPHHWRKTTHGLSTKLVKI